MILDILSEEEVSQILKVGIPTLRRWRKKNIVLPKIVPKHIYIGTKVFYNRSDIEDYLRQVGVNLELVEEKKP